jgi:hypothetical protein
MLALLPPISDNSVKRRHHFRVKRRRVALGSWTLPSGNACDVDLADTAVNIRWDRLPVCQGPLDRVDYEHRILPAILKACANYLEVPIDRAMGVLVR